VPVAVGIPIFPASRPATRGSVVRGTGNAARVVTSAALIMFIIFAIGVFIDAFVVRLTLIPAIMAVIGARIWYHPKWFARYVPDPDIEGRRLEDLTDVTPAVPAPVRAGDA
jgi:hypothetical protein